MKSLLAEAKVNVPEPSSMNTTFPVVLDRTPDINVDPPAGGHMKVCSRIKGVDSLYHLFKSKSASANEDAMGALMEFVLLQEMESRSST